jgi:hypothetical protein
LSLFNGRKSQLGTPAKPKRWKEYLLEFGMIFLAVTLGFFAESYRENLAEISKEKQLIQSFIEDLSSDTLGIQRTLDFRHEKFMMMDSLMQLISREQIKGHENDLYYYSRRLVRNVSFQSNDRTISSLRNSDASALVRNEQAMDSIISYYKVIDRLVSNGDDDRTERFNASAVISKIFDPFTFDQMVAAKGINRPTGNPPLRSYDRTLQLDLAYNIHQLKGSSYLITDRLNLLRAKARNTIALLKNEYHLN